MARLMVVPIRNRGHAVLIVTRYADIELIGFVARTALRGFFQDNPSMCNCMSFVELNLPTIEQILLRKTLQDEVSEEQMLCVEITSGRSRQRQGPIGISFCECLHWGSNSALRAVSAA